MKIYEGKTKDVYAIDDEKVMFQFKDQVTGKDGHFDPGENQVGMKMAGFAHCSLQLSTYFFEKLKKEGIATHFIESNLDKNTMTAFKAAFFGPGIEVIVRRKAVGSFLRRYRTIALENQTLEYLVEFTLKDDEMGDPLITKDALLALQVLDEETYDKMKELAVTITKIIESDMQAKGLTLFDIKLEFGMVQNQLALIDEISPGNMRVYKDGKFQMPLEVCASFFDK